MQYEISLNLIHLEADSYHLLLEARVGDQACNLVLDTGASKTVFDQSYLEELGLDLEEVDGEESSGVNALIAEMYTTCIPEFAMESFVVANYETVGMDLSHVNAMYQRFVEKPIHGLLGSDFLVKYKALIDYQNCCLILKVDMSSE